MKHQLLVIDFGGTSIKLAFMDQQGNFIERSSMATITDSIDELLAGLKTAIQPYVDRFSGIALSMPGRVDAQAGILYEAGAINCLFDYPIVQWFTQQYHVPCTIENDANCVALAQLWQGPMQECRDFICLVLGTGIGGAIVIDGKLHRGFHHYSGEFGYLMLKSGQTIEDFLTWEALDGSTKSFISYLHHYPQYAHLNGQELFDSGEEHLVHLRQRYFLQIAAAIYSLQQIVDPEFFVIGGGVSARVDIIESINHALKALINQRDIPFFPQVYSCVHLQDANLIGALYHHLTLQGIL